MFLRYYTLFALCLLTFNSTIPSDKNDQLMERAKKLYPKPRPIEDPITLDDINAILPYAIESRKNFINSYKRKLASAQKSEDRWNSDAWGDVRGKLWRTPTYINKLTLNYFGYNEFLQFQPDPYKYYSTEPLTEFFKQQLKKYAQNNLVKEFIQANEEIIRIRKEIDEIGVLRHFINGSEGLQSDLQYGFKKPSKQEILEQIQDLEKYQDDLNKSNSPLIQAEMKRTEYQNAVKALKDIRNHVAKMKEPEKPVGEKTVTTEAPTPTTIQPTIQQPVTIQAPASTAQKQSQSYWDVFRGYMARMARMFGW